MLIKKMIWEMVDLRALQGGTLYVKYDHQSSLWELEVYARCGDVGVCELNPFASVSQCHQGWMVAG